MGQENEGLVVFTYIAYLAISISLTMRVADDLHKHGAIFLKDVFRGKAELAAAANHFLVMGVCLIFVAFVTFTLKSNDHISSARGALEWLSEKLSYVLFILGGMHFFNLLAYSQVRTHRLFYNPEKPPVSPDAVLKVVVPR